MEWNDVTEIVESDGFQGPAARPLNWWILKQKCSARVTKIAFCLEPTEQLIRRCVQLRVRRVWKQIDSPLD
jgi:hypothetical protein